jgi:hypothetical protein
MLNNPEQQDDPSRFTSDGWDLGFDDDEDLVVDLPEEEPAKQ